VLFMHGGMFGTGSNLAVAGSTTVAIGPAPCAQAIVDPAITDALSGQWVSSVPSEGAIHHRTDHTIRQLG
jgi:hypothetical protein